MPVDGPRRRPPDVVAGARLQIPQDAVEMREAMRLSHQIVKQQDGERRRKYFRDELNNNHHHHSEDPADKCIEAGRRPYGTAGLALVMTKPIEKDAEIRDRIAC